MSLPGENVVWTGDQNYFVLLGAPEPPSPRRMSRSPVIFFARFTDSGETQRGLHVDFDFRLFYFSIQGRVSRKQWWLRLILPFLVISVLLGVFDAALGTVDPTSGIGLLSKVWLLVALIPSIFVHIKRFHDRDKSGWWVLIGLVPFIGALWLLIELGFLKGTPGPNQFGPQVIE